MLLRNVSEVCISLYFIFNVSLQNGAFPDELKIARVTPLFKNGSDSDLGNYTPVPVLPCFSKILEKIMYNAFLNIRVTIMIFTGNNLAFKKSAQPSM